MKNTSLLLLTILAVSMSYAQEIKSRKISINKNLYIESIESNMTWQDLKVDERAVNQIKDIENTLNNRRNWLNNKDKTRESDLKPSQLVLFQGGPGTGKTLTASLLGKYTKSHVFRVNLSMVVSKSTDKTEKHIDKIFDFKKDEESILFFDEADVLFSKINSTQSTRNNSVNKNLKHFLQRLETHSGLVILSTSSENNIDISFKERLDAIINF